MSKMKKLLSFMEILLFAVFGIIPGILVGFGFGVLIAYVAGQFPVDSGGGIPLALGAFLEWGSVLLCGIFGSHWI